MRNVLEQKIEAAKRTRAAGDGGLCLTGKGVVSDGEIDATRLVGNGSEVVSDLSGVCRGEYKKFPIDALPESLAQLVRAGSASIGCDPSMISVPGLVTLAAAIGGTRVVEVLPGYTEPAILWGAVIAESSARKSPGFDLATAPLADAQREYFRTHAEDVRRNQEMLNEGLKNSPPTCRRVVVDDVTLDAMAPILRDNPRGVLLACEELDGWFQSFTRYAAGGASDRPRWLKLFGGRQLVVDRKGGGCIAIPRAIASITGTIQPGVFARALSRDVRESGLAARMLLAMPPRTPFRWSDTPLDSAAVDAHRATVLSLLNIPLEEYDGGDPRPRVLPLTPDAVAIMKDHVNKTGERMDDAESDERAALGKLAGVAARLALVVELAYSPNPAEVREVSADAMRCGVTLARWFSGEVLRVYGLLGETCEERTYRELLEWVRRKGGDVSARDLQKPNAKKYPTSESAEAALSVLVSAGFGEWVNVGCGSKGGRVSRRFRLLDLTGV